MQQCESKYVDVTLGNLQGSTLVRQPRRRLIKSCNIGFWQGLGSPATVSRSKSSVQVTTHDSISAKHVGVSLARLRVFGFIRQSQLRHRTSATHPALAAARSGGGRRKTFVTTSTQRASLTGTSMFMSATLLLVHHLPGILKATACSSGRALDAKTPDVGPPRGRGGHGGLCNGKCGAPARAAAAAVATGARGGERWQCNSS
ncbi:unnamed protein product [Symbiodinium natans]|uniref:Uncharacterized protein n=1 Tax=Symbiodinium natans TaxID=878477 RepID=A0A812QMU1_9DINO|nr:unnamed protein product [Symbiodinium natans]